MTCCLYFCYCAGVLLIVDTPVEHKYERIWKEVTDRQFWTFMVRAGGDVHVILTEQLGVTNANIYEFVVGGWYNNRSVIRTEVLGGGESIKASVDIKNVVSSSERREFWISWWKGQLEVRPHSVYTSQLTDKDDGRSISIQRSCDLQVLQFNTPFGFCGNDIYSMQTHSVYECMHVYVCLREYTCILNSM